MSTALTPSKLDVSPTISTEQWQWVPVVQVMMKSTRHHQQDRDKARALVLDWAGEARRWRRGWRESIPDTAYEGVPFEALEDAVHIQTSRSSDGKLWCFHVEHPDGDQSREGRRWILEAFVADRDTHDEFGVRVFCLAAPLSFVPSNTPALVKQFIKAFDLDDNHFEIRETPYFADDEDGYYDFTDTLLSKERQLPLVVVSQMIPREGPPGYAAKPEILARALQGVAHVVVLPVTQANWLAEEVGHDLAVFRGAIRVYMPGFHAHADKMEHSLYIPKNIVMNSTSKSLDKHLPRRLRLFTVSSPAKLENWPLADTSQPAMESRKNLFEGLRKAIRAFRGALT